MTEHTLSFVHRFVPSPSGKNTPTLLLLHGTGGDENDLLQLGQILAPGASLLSPRGKSLDEGAPRFFRRLAEGVFDVPDLIRRSHELADFIAAASKQYNLDPSRVFAVGYSNGANIAASTMLLRPEAMAGAVLLRPMVPFVPDRPPDLTAKPVLILAGERDPIVSPAESNRLADLLRSAGADVILEWTPGGHALDPTDIAVAQTWLAEHFAMTD